MELETDLETDILIAGVEGGINYWAGVENYDYKNCSVDILVEDEDEETLTKHHIDKVMIRIGLARVAGHIPRNENSMVAQTGEHARRIVSDKWAGNEDWDGFQDADTADIIIQFAIFGDLVYG